MVCSPPTTLKKILRVSRTPGVHFGRLFHISVFFYEYNVYKQFQLKVMEYPDQI
jgi:hypothetical protein